MSAAAGVTSLPASGTSSPARGATGALTPSSAAMMDDAGVQSQTNNNSNSSGTRPKKRGKASALLRDYYGLSGGLSTANEDPTDPDSASFDKRKAYEAILASSTLPQLLKKEADLLTEIRELDGERQSLVYNHHHELISASETIAKMKARAESLDASLEALKTSFSSISQLSSELSAAPPAAAASSGAPSGTDASSSGARTGAGAGAGAGAGQAAAGATATAAAAAARDDGTLDVRIGDAGAGGDAATLPRTLTLPPRTQRELQTIVELPARLRETIALHASNEFGGTGGSSAFRDLRPPAAASAGAAADDTGAGAGAEGRQGAAPASASASKGGAARGADEGPQPQSATSAGGFLITPAALAAAEKLWGQCEPVLARWSEEEYENKAEKAAGDDEDEDGEDEDEAAVRRIRALGPEVPRQVRGIAAECRAILRDAAAAVASSAGGSGTAGAGAGTA